MKVSVGEDGRKRTLVNTVSGNVNQYRKQFGGLLKT